MQGFVLSSGAEGIGYRIHVELKVLVIKCSFLKKFNPLFSKRTSFGVLLYDIISVPKDDIDFMA
jgi:hypothetical protein